MIARYEHIVAWAIRILLFVVPFIPLYVADSLFFPYITGKAFAFRIIVEIAFALWVWLAIFSPKYRPRKQPIVLAVVFFISILSLATLLSEQPQLSFWSNFERMEGLVAHIHFALYFFVVAHLFTAFDWAVFFNLTVFAGFLESLFALSQKLGFFISPYGAGVVDGTIGNVTYIAAYLTFVLIFSLYLLYEHRSSHVLIRLYYFIVALCCALIIYYASSRGPVLSLLLGATVFGLLHFYFIRSSRIPLYVIAILVLFFGIIFSLRHTDFVQHNPVLTKLTSYDLRSGTIDARFNIWKVALSGIADHPLLGWGPNTFPLIFSKYYRPELWGQEPWFDRTHNFVFDWLISGGILGLIGYLSMIGAALYSLIIIFRRNLLSHTTALLFGTLFVVYLFQNLFVFDQFATYLNLFSVFAFLCSVIMRASPMRHVVPGVAVHEFALLIPPLVLLPLLTLSLYFVNIKPLSTNLALINAMRLGATGDIEATFKEYTRSLSFGFLGQQEIRPQFIRFGGEFAPQASIPEASRIQMLQTIVSEGEKEIAVHPQDPRMHLFLGSLLNQIGLTDAALGFFEKALILSPKRQLIYFQLGDIYMRRGEMDRAITLLKQAFDLDPRFTTARINLAVAYVIAQKQDVADELLTQGFGTPYPADSVFSRLYQGLNDYVRLAEVYRSFIVSYPEDSKYRIELARTLLSLGRRRDAISAIEQAGVDIPTFKVSADELIVKLKRGEKI